jgi:hypothetical protein
MGIESSGGKKNRVLNPRKHMLEEAQCIEEEERGQ